MNYPYRVKAFSKEKKLTYETKLYINESESFILVLRKITQLLEDHNFDFNVADCVAVIAGNKNPNEFFIQIERTNDNDRI